MDDSPDRWSFHPSDRLRLAGFFGFIAVLHLLGWGLYLHHVAGHPALVGLGLAAYLLGLRHAFDADHIAAVDDTVRYLMHKGRNPLGVGFWFSLGHCTIVLLLAVAISCLGVALAAWLPTTKGVGSLIGSGVSGVFLWIVGALNLLVLLDILDVWKKATRGTHGHGQLDRLLRHRGLLDRLFGGRLQGLIDHAWHMYPLGLLFGLGFDTASEIALLAMTAGAATGDLPIAALLSLPILFAAGMSLMDTTDGVLMAKAYDRAFVDPLRRIFYNLVTTGLSIFVAIVIGTVEILQVVTRLLDLRGGFFDVVRDIDFGRLGYLIVGLFLLAWVLATVLWKVAARDGRYPGRAGSTLDRGHHRGFVRRSADVRRSA